MRFSSHPNQSFKPTDGRTDWVDDYNPLAVQHLYTYTTSNSNLKISFSHDVDFRGPFANID